MSLDVNGKELQAFANYLQGPADGMGNSEVGAAFVDFQSPVGFIGSQSQDGGTTGGSGGGGSSLEGEGQQRKLELISG